MFPRRRYHVGINQALAGGISLVSGGETLFNGWRAGLVVFVVGCALAPSNQWIDRDVERIVVFDGFTT